MNVLTPLAALPALYEGFELFLPRRAFFAVAGEYQWRSTGAMRTVQPGFRVASRMSTVTRWSSVV